MTVVIRGNVMKLTVIRLSFSFPF